MSPRRYRADRRQAAAEQTRRKIVESTVELHAARGVTATTYAMIAKRADVAVPTVYNHFPTRAELLAACTGRVAAEAPAFGPEIYDDADDVEARLRATVGAHFAYHGYYAPWMRWAVHEARSVPELEEWLRTASAARRELIVLALEPAFGPAPPEPLIALCNVLLDFPAWQSLTEVKSLGPEEAEALIAETLIALVREHGGENGAARGPR
jgi:AcrR family transcriptional regulator